MTADYVIVGSGVNALVAAALLGKKGRRVLVLERNDRIGGCIRTEAITAPGFIHDVMATTFVLFITSPAYAALAGDLAARGLEFAHSPSPTGVLLPDGRHLIFSMDRARNVAAFDALAPGDGARFAADMTRLGADAPFLFTLLGGSLWSWDMLRVVAREAWRRGPRGLATFFGEALLPARAWLEQRYRAPLFRDLWAPWVLHTGLGPESAYSGQMAKVIAFALEAAGAPIVKGGAVKFLQAFETLIKDNGGEIRVSADVASILLDGEGSARGVKLADGAEIAATRGVICSVTPNQLYERLLPGAARPPRGRRKPRRLSLRQGRHADPLCAEIPAEMARSGTRQGRAAASDVRPRRRLEGRQRGRARHAAGRADGVRRATDRARPESRRRKARRYCGCSFPRRRGSSRATRRARSRRRPTGAGARRFASVSPTASRRCSPIISKASATR